MKHIKKNINIYIEVLIIICFAIIIFNMNTYIIGKDDEVYKSVFNSFSTFKTWAVEFYNTWSGRIVTSALSNIFLRMPSTIYKVSNTLVYMLAIFAILKIVQLFNKTTNLKKTVLLFCLFAISFIIDKSVIETGVKWVTGSFNYLWPTAFMLVAMIPFIKSINNYEIKKIWFIIYILSDFIACFAEQTALVLLCFGTISLIYTIIKNKGRFNKLLLVHYILIVILAIIELSAPGNFVRVLASTLRRYPTFYMLSIGDKVLQGGIVLANQLLNAEYGIMIILTVLIGIKNIISKDKGIIIKLFSLIPMTYFLCSIIARKIGRLEGELYNILPFGKEYIYGITIYIPIAVFIINILLISILIFFSFEDIKKSIFVTLLYLGSLASALSISFSPTIYASGTRIFLLTDFLLIAVIGIFIASIISNNKDEENIFKKWIKKIKTLLHSKKHFGNDCKLLNMNNEINNR